MSSRNSFVFGSRSLRFESRARKILKSDTGDSVAISSPPLPHFKKSCVACRVPVGGLQNDADITISPCKLITSNGTCCGVLYPYRPNQSRHRIKMSSLSVSICSHGFILTGLPVFVCVVSLGYSSKVMANRYPKLLLWYLSFCVKSLVWLPGSLGCSSEGRLGSVFPC